MIVKENAIKKNFLIRIFVLLLLIVSFNLNSVAQSVSQTYNSGDISTNLNSYSSTCNGPVTPLVVNILPGMLVTGVDVLYDMTAANGGWRTDQNTRLYCQETATNEPSYSSGVGNSGGTYSYNRTALTIANGISVSGILTFEIHGYRDWGGSGCNTTYNKIDNTTWQVTVHYSAVTSPGGVLFSDLALWLKADVGTNCTTNACDISSWSDNSSNGNNASQVTATNQPAFILTDHNYNPGIDFQEPNQDLMTIVDDASLDLGNDHAIFLLTDLEAGVDGFISPLSKHTSSFLSTGYGFHAFYSDVSPWFNAADLKTTYGVNVSTITPSSDAATIPASIDGIPDILLGSYNGSNVSLTKDGGAAVSTPFSNSIVANTSPLVLGADHDNLTVTSHFDGHLNEVIMFDATLSAIEQRKVESYLAIKYGVTLDNSFGGTSGDYRSTNNLLLWDASINSSYHNDVIGIGRDDGEGLLQKQSHTQNDSLRVYVSNLAVNNNVNAGSVTNDESYIVIGHNNEPLKASALPSTEQPVGIYSRIDREWKVTNTNFSDEFSIEMKLEIPNTSIILSDLRLLVDTDDNFTNATIISPPDVTFSFGSVIISGIGTAEIPLNSIRYITLASGVSTTPLPIELLNFDATVIDNKYVQCDWKTGSENNNDYFEVERSADGLNWGPVDKISGTGNSSSLSNYSINDSTPYSGVSYYRLKQVDFNGQFSYSQTRSVVLKIDNKLLLYPNPANIIIRVEGPLKEINNISVYNMLGQDLTNQISFSLNNNIATLELTSLSAGYYCIKTLTQTITFVKH